MRFLRCSHRTQNRLQLQQHLRLHLYLTRPTHLLQKGLRNPRNHPCAKRPPSRRNPLSRRQLKTVLQGLREVVAEDRFLQAVAVQSTLDDTPHLWHLPQVSAPADLRARLRNHAEEGPPGLVHLIQRKLAKRFFSNCSV